MILSVGLMILSIGSLLTQGLNLGVDFEGGTLIEVGYPGPVELDAVRKRLEESGFETVGGAAFRVGAGCAGADQAGRPSAE